MRRLATMVLGGAIALAACTGSGYEPLTEATGEGGATAAPARASAMLFVQRTGGGATQDVQVGARFVHVAGLSDDALPDLVGTPAVAPTGTCVERSAPAAADAARAEVRLLDVGAVDVRTADGAVRMYPRRFPDLWNVVSGVLYGVDGASMHQGRWRFTGLGDAAAGVGPFDVEALSPDDLTGVRLGDIALPSPPNTAVVLHRGPLAVRWNRGYTEDRVAVVFEGASTIVCGARDEGWMDIDAATVDRVAEVLRSGGSVSVHRQRSRSFVATGLDTGTVLFDMAVRSLAQLE